MPRERLWYKLHSSYILGCRPICCILARRIFIGLQTFSLFTKWAIFFLLVEYGKKISDNKSLRVCRPSHSLGTYRWGRSSSRQMKLCKLDNKVHEIRRQSGRKISWHTKILEMKENVWFILFGLDIYRASNRTLSINSTRNCYKKLAQLHSKNKVSIRRLTTRVLETCYSDLVRRWSSLQFYQIYSEFWVES